MNEKQVQKLLFARVLLKKHHNVAIPNTYLYDWESDFISVTKSGYIHEYEIKLTLSDFKADMKKEAKHNLISRAYATGRGRVPAYFWYVVTFDIDIAMIPEYAGLLKARNGYLYEIKPAPRMVNEKMNHTQMIDCLRRLSHKLHNEMGRQTAQVAPGRAFW